MAFEYQIEMLSVGAADAFMLYCRDSDKEKDCLVLIDCGSYDDGKKVKAHLEKYYHKIGKKNVDCAIVTHCHEDHFGGFIYLLEENIKIDKFYINIPSECVPMPKIKQKVDAVYSTDGKNLVDLIVAKEKESKTSHSSCFTYATIPLIDDDCPNLKVLSPTKAYYTDLVNKFIKKAKLEEYQASESAYPIYSQALEKSDDDDSPYNSSSIIFNFDNGKSSNNKYLFMGDANETAYEKIPQDLKYLAEDVFWLKVPHHGSERNISNEMIEKIKPKEAYISTEKYGHYLDKDVVNALTKARCRIYCTKDGTSFLHKGFTEHNDYHSVEPMNKETLEKQDKN